MFGGTLHHVESAVEIGGDNCFPAFVGVVDSGLRKLPASVVDQHIKLAILLPDAVKQLIDLLGITDVGLVGGHFATELLQVLNASIELFLLASADNNARSQSSEQTGNGFADATTTAGY